MSTAASSCAAAASSNASQLNEGSQGAQPVLTQAWALIHKFGRFPKRPANPETEAEAEVNSLCNFLYVQKKLGIPDYVWQQMRDYDASQPVDTVQHLIDDIKRLGRYPK